MRIVRPALLSTLPLLLVVSGASANASTLLPHRAVYDLALDRATERSGITGLAGRMVYEFDGSACEGYTITFRFVSRIDGNEESRITDQQTTTWENAEGDRFNFDTRSYVDNELDREIKGSASRDARGTVVSLERPDSSEQALEVTQFPTQHLLEVIAKANEGETFYETTLFDASEDADRVMTTTVIIGRKAAARANDPELSAIQPLAAEPFWPVDIAYFDMSSVEGEELPVYRISFKLHESGVTRDLVMDYGDFSMKGRLVELAMMEKPADCDR